MSTKSQQLYNKAKDRGKVKEMNPWLNLAKQVEDEQGNFRGTEPTGKHVVEFVDDKAVKGTKRKSDEEIDMMQYTYKIVKKPKEVGDYEEGDKVAYRKPVHGNDGNLHYFVRNMAQFDYGDTIALEYVQKGQKKGYIDVSPAMDSVPVVEENENIEEEMKGEASRRMKDDITPDDIPF